MPSRFQIMRRNRHRQAVIERERRHRIFCAIEEAETEVDAEWAKHRQRLLAERYARFADTHGFMRDMRQELVKMLPAPRARWWQVWKWFKRSGRAELAG
jgi:hypothetical protein